MKSKALNVNWLKEKKRANPSFQDLELNTPFRNIGPDSKGAVYIKVAYQSPDGNYYPNFPKE